MTLMLGKTGGQEEKRANRGWDVWLASPTQWTWVWANSRRQWRIGKPGVLQSMGLQRVRQLNNKTIHHSLHAVHYIPMIYLCINTAASLYFSTSFTHCIHAPLSCLWQSPICPLYPWTQLFLLRFVLVFAVVVFRFYMKWDHMVFVFLCVTYLSIMPSRSIQVIINFNISLIFNAWRIFILYIFYNFFIHSSVNGYIISIPWLL